MFSGPRPSGQRLFWTPGTAILWRYRREFGTTESAYPMTVVADDADFLVAWLPPGTPILRPVLPDGRHLRAVGPLEMYVSGRALKRDVWGGHGSLRINPAGAAWSMFVFWDDDRRHTSWYVNLEDPHVRDDVGILTQDHILDLVVTPDRVVHWKDLDELEGAVEAGRFTQNDADVFVERAREVEKRIAAWESPFSDGWEHWQPDPSWPTPQLPEGIVADF